MKVLFIILGIIAFFVIIVHFSLTVIVNVDNKNGVKYTVKYFGFTLYPRKPKKKKAGRKSKKKKEPEPEEDDYLSDDELMAQLDLIDNGADIDDHLDDNADTYDELPDTTPQAEVIKEEKPVKKQKKKEKKEKEKKQESKPADTTEEPLPDIDDDEEEEEESSSRGGIGGLIDKYHYYKPLIPMGWKYFKKLLRAIRFYDTDIELYTAKPDAYDSAMFYGKLQMAVNNGLSLLCRIFTVKVKDIDIRCGFNEKRLDYNVSSRVKLRPSTVIAIAACVGINYLIFRIKNKMKAKKKTAQVTDALDETVKKSA